VVNESVVSGNALAQKGVGALLDAIENLILMRYAGLENAALTRARHVDCIGRAKTLAEGAMDRLGADPELASEDIRLALRALEELAGRSDVEQVFDRIFSSFCIGK